jgi:hypothetical protein
MKRLMVSNLKSADGHGSRRWFGFVMALIFVVDVPMKKKKKKKEDVENRAAWLQ